jgi:hypothetical protein
MLKNFPLPLSQSGHCLSWSVRPCSLQQLILLSLGGELHNSSAFCVTCHFSNFTNFDSSIFPYETFKNDTIFISVQGLWYVSLFLWVIIQCRLAIFKFVAPYTHTLFFGWKLSGCKHSLIWNESRSDTPSALKILPLHGPQTWNGFLSAVVLFTCRA